MMSPCVGVASAVRWYSDVVMCGCDLCCELVSDVTMCGYGLCCELVSDVTMCGCGLCCWLVWTGIVMSSHVYAVSVVWGVCCEFIHAVMNIQGDVILGS